MRLDIWWALLTAMLAHFVQWALLMFELEDRFPIRSGPEFWKAREEAGRKFIAHAWEMANPNYKGDKYTDSMRWWGMANEAKNSGLYADFLNGRWLSPEFTPREAFSRSQSIVEDFIQLVKATLAHLDSLSAEEQSSILQAARKTLKAEKRYANSKTRRTK